MMEKQHASAGFTLIELMASMAILGLIMVMLFSVFDQVNKAWLNGENRVETFTQARAIMDLMSRELSQAIATTKIPFYLPDANHIYFVAPVNAVVGSPAADLCEVGYEFVNLPPSVPATLTRKFSQSTDSQWNFYTQLPASWAPAFNSTEDAPLAEGSVLNLTFTCYDANGNPLGHPYRAGGIGGNKLPYAIVVSMDVVDSRTLARLTVVGDPTGISHPQITQPAVRSFSTTVYLSNLSNTSP
jgi:prepilin-type N-terminal cleavage/methylation domain-containing protein